ncbi:hypothetical protein J6590_025670 [Homalodisca vitripennis]|nr:hypothetical protein J6590_025670 [Homalodisca vitripennis]
MAMGVPMAERSKSLDIRSELEIAQVQILSVTVALFISTINLVLYRPSPLFCLIRCSHRPVAHEDRQNKALKGIGLSLKKKKKYPLPCIIIYIKFTSNHLIFKYELSQSNKNTSISNNPATLLLKDTAGENT